MPCDSVCLICGKETSCKISVCTECEKDLIIDWKNFKIREIGKRE
jgi:hypothetical protein